MDIESSAPAYHKDGSRGSMTVRAEIASRAMAGLLADPNCSAFPDKVAKAAVDYADALIEELNKDISK